MKALNLTKQEKNILYQVLIQPDKDADYRKVYFRGKILEKLEEKRIEDEDGTFKLQFNENPLEISDTDYLMIRGAFKDFQGWNYAVYPTINSLIKKLELENEIGELDGKTSEQK